MKHSNPNMVQPVLEGIAVGEKLGEGLIDIVLEDTEWLERKLATQRTGRFLPARALAFNQGVIAAYRSRTEFLTRDEYNARVQQLVQHGATLEEAFATAARRADVPG